jgi:hypothetical protein
MAGEVIASPCKILSPAVYFCKTSTGVRRDALVSFRPTACRTSAHTQKGSRRDYQLLDQQPCALTLGLAPTPGDLQRRHAASGSRRARTTTAWLLRRCRKRARPRLVTLVLTLPLMAANLHHAFLLDLVVRLAAVLGLLTGNALLRLGVELA